MRSIGSCKEIKKSIMFMTINFQIKPRLYCQLHTNWQLLLRIYDNLDPKTCFF